MTPIIIYLVLSILFGIISCLFGKKLYFPLLMITVFITIVTFSLSLFDLTLKAGIIILIIGVIAALTARFFYMLGIFFLGGLLGGGLSLLIITILPSSAAQFGWILTLLFTIVFGLCAVKWCDFFIMASTSFNGAFAIAVPVCFLCKEMHHLHNFIYGDDMLSTVTNLNQYLNNQFPEENAILIFLLTFLIALGGLYFQMNANKKVKNKRR